MTVDAEQDRIEIVIDLNAPIARVWRAISDYVEFGTWFRVRLDGPFEVGKTTTGHMTFPGHESVQWVSLTERMEPERVFAFSWPPSAVDPETEYARDAKINVEFRLTPTAGGTRLTITETGFRQFPESKRLDVLRSNTEGWTIQSKHIAAHVERD